MKKSPTTKRKSKPRTKGASAGASGAALVDARIKDLADWRGKTLARVRAIIKQALPDVVEEVKWRKPSNGMLGIPVWSHPAGNIICTGETYKSVVKLTFAKGAALDDPSGLFNASLEGNTRRAIDIREGEKINERAFKALVRAGSVLNADVNSKRSDTKSSSRRSSNPRLLAGGNPQIAKADGDEPVQKYIAAIPGWKRDVARRLDELIERTVPKVNKAVKWNSPFYGVPEQGWFLSFHCFTNYVKVAFFRGTSLHPMPPDESKQKEVRYVNIHEDAPFDDAQIAAWVKQASKLPGWSGSSRG